MSTEGNATAPHPSFGEPDGETTRDVLAGAAGWVALDKWVSRGVTLLTFAVLGHLLGPRPFGLVALATVVTSVMLLFVDLGFGKALIQRAHLDPEHADATFWTSMVIAALLAAVVAILAGPLSEMMGEPALTPVLRWLSLTLPLTTLQTTPSSLLERTFAYRQLTIRHLIGNVAGAVVGLACAFAGAGVWSLVAQTLSAAAIGSAVLWRLSDWHPRLRFSFGHARELWSFSWSVMGVETALLVNTQADRFIVGAVAGPTMLGYYTIGTRVESIAVEVITSVMATVSLPGFSRLQHDLRRVRSMFYAATRLSATVAIPVFAAMAVLAPLLIPMLFGNKWGASIKVMQIVMVLGMFQCVAYFDAMVLLAVGRQRWTLGIVSGQALFNIVASLIAVRHGLVAVAIAVTVRQYIFWPVRWLALKHGIGLSVPFYLRQWLDALLACIPLVAGMTLLYRLGRGVWPAGELWRLVEVGFLSTLGAAVYIASLRLMAPARFEEVWSLARPFLVRIGMVAGRGRQRVPETTG